MTTESSPTASTARLDGNQIDALAARVAPILRERNETVGAEDDDCPDRTVMALADTGTLLNALYAAGVLVFEDASDRAHLRRNWTAVSTALIHLSQGRRLTPEVLAAVPTSHRFYLMGHEAGHEQLATAWRRMSAAREDLAAILRRGTVPAPATLGAILAEVGGENPYAGDRPADADPWWGGWIDPAAAPEPFRWERYERTCDPDAQLDGLGDLCAFLGGTWSEGVEGSSFTAMVLRLIVKSQATPEKFNAVERAFPREVTAWRAWMGLSPSPTARELYAVLAGDPPAADRPDERPAPVYAETGLRGDLMAAAQLERKVDARAAAYAGAIVVDQDGDPMVLRDALRPETVGGPDLRALIPAGARAYALPWPAGARAVYHPINGVGLEEVPGPGPLPDSVVLWRDLFVEANHGMHRVLLGRVRLLDAAAIEAGRLHWSCRHCGLGATDATTEEARVAERDGHEAICPDQDRVRATIPAGEDRHA